MPGGIPAPNRLVTSHAARETSSASPFALTRNPPSRCMRGRAEPMHHQGLLMRRYSLPDVLGLQRRVDRHLGFPQPVCLSAHRRSAEAAHALACPGAGCSGFPHGEAGAGGDAAQGDLGRLPVCMHLTRRRSSQSGCYASCSAPLKTSSTFITTAAWPGYLASSQVCFMSSKISPLVS